MKNYILNVIEDKITKSMVMSTLLTRNFCTNIEPFCVKGAIKVMRNMRDELGLLILELELEGGPELIRIAKGEKVQGYQQLKGCEDVPIILLGDSDTQNIVEYDSYFPKSSLKKFKGKENFADAVARYINK